MRGVETEWLCDVTEAGGPVLKGLEVILQIRRLGGHFCGDLGAFASPPSPDKFKKWLFLFRNVECRDLVKILPHMFF